MSKKYPECPLYNHDNCKQFHNSKVCAVIREDDTCLRERYKNTQKTNGKIGKSILVKK
jgi:hypothetical protein